MERHSAASGDAPQMAPVVAVDPDRQNLFTNASSKASVCRAVAIDAECDEGTSRRCFLHVRHINRKEECKNTRCRIPTPRANSTTYALRALSFEKASVPYRARDRWASRLERCELAVVADSRELRLIVACKEPEISDAVPRTSHVMALVMAHLQGKKTQIP